MLPPFHDEDAFVERLCAAATTKDKPITFLVGSAISAPDHPGSYGVLAVPYIIDSIREIFRNTDGHQPLQASLSGTSADQYQRAFEFLIGRRGQDAANQVIRRAVFNALHSAKWPAGLPFVGPEAAETGACRALEEHNESWVLPSAVDTLGRLVVTCADTFGRSLLTTNFDPLIQLSIRRHGGRYYRTVLHQDGNLGQTVGDGTHIVHLHGYWHGYDTLHTGHQLGQPRPQLHKSLARLLESSTIVVLGYGGWDDVLTRTLADLSSDAEGHLDLLWAFHGNDAAAIAEKNQTLLAAFSASVGRGRATFYKGIDCRTALLSVVQKLEPLYSTPSNVAIRETASAHGQRRIRIEIEVPGSGDHSSEPDSLPSTDTWVGRDTELRVLSESTQPVVFITGIGGQGKSALAAKYLKSVVQSNRYDHWDWRDCREESDRLATQILRVIERLSDGAIQASEIDATDIRAITSNLFRVLGNRRCLLVFDNVDQYVDLESMSPIKGLETLVAEAHLRNHQSQIVLTCRPNVSLSDDRALSLSVSGLNGDEVRQLLTKNGLPSKDVALADELQNVTVGHPLWISLLAMQSVREQGGLRGVLDGLKQGQASLPETTRSIWQKLNAHQQGILRTMAELDRPESEDRLLELLPGINFNRVNRALRTLRSFHLVETRRRPEGETFLDLHPLIRAFVRKEFPKKDRERFVGSLMGFLDRMIGRFKDLLPSRPSYEILEHWVRKADLQLTFGRTQEAILTINEVATPLIARGYAEELVRLTTILLRSIDWAEACSSYKEFDSLLSTSLKLMVELGRVDDALKWLDKYEGGLPGKSAQYINLCDLRCYAYWYIKNFDEALRWGSEGERLREATKVDTVFSSRHNLALAQRDSGQVVLALDAFLDGQILDEVLKRGEVVAGKGPHFFGNIGRCLFLVGELDQAMICYRKCAELLEVDLEKSARLNKGYIRLWIGDLAAKNGDLKFACACYRAAVAAWEEVSPPRAGEAVRKIQDLLTLDPGSPQDAMIDMKSAEWEFKAWLERPM